MDPILIKFFKAAVATRPLVKDPEALQTEALKRGFLIHPDVLNEDVAAFVAAESISPNSTFYQTWEDITSKNRWELFIDQVLHYSTTYGTNFDKNAPKYIPNPGADEPDLTKYTFIGPISEKELYVKCLGLVTSGIALKKDTVAAVCSFIIERVKGQKEKLDIDSVKNREALSILASALDMRPSDPVALLRFIVYESTGETLLIKNKELINLIKRSEKQFDFNKLTDAERDALASVFYRFKDLFLAFRSHETKLYHTEKKMMVVEPSLSRKVINKIRRRAERLHKPLGKGYWETLLSEERPVGEVASKLKGLSTFKVVSLLQTVRERLRMMDADSKRMYLIRNGKTFVNTLKADKYSNLKYYYTTLESLFEGRLLEVLTPKACSVSFPEQVTLACPSSEKNFIGNYPFGSWYPLSENNYFGIYWRNEWGAHDLDISFVYLGGGKIGWNDAYLNPGHAIYSGDMTNADPEASEIFYCKGTCSDGIIFCNRYSGQELSRFRFYFGQDKIDNLKRNYMVDPNSIVVNEELESVSRQMMLGAVSGGKIFLMSLAVGNSRVSSGMDANDKSVIIARKALCFAELRPLLLKAGFREAAEGETPELDLTEPQKDTLIKLFAD